jgi:hypothetical protein
VKNLASAQNKLPPSPPHKGEGSDAPHASKASGTAKKLLALFTLSLLAGPVEYLAHEGAHYGVARLLGANATLHFDRVTLAGARFGYWENFAFAGAGPLVDWVVGLTALWLLAHRYTPLRLVLAIWLARPLQFLPALLGVDLYGLGLGTNLRFTDEGVVAEALGLSPAVFIWLETAVAAPLLAEIVVLMPRPRLAALATMTVGVLAGWAGWLILGPYVLP